MVVLSKNQQLKCAGNGRKNAHEDCSENDVR